MTTQKINMLRFIPNIKIEIEGVDGDYDLDSRDVYGTSIQSNGIHPTESEKNYHHSKLVHYLCLRGYAFNFNLLKDYFFEEIKLQDVSDFCLSPNGTIVVKKEPFYVKYNGKDGSELAKVLNNLEPCFGCNVRPLWKDKENKIITDLTMQEELHLMGKFGVLNLPALLIASLLFKPHASLVIPSTDSNAKVGYTSSILFSQRYGAVLKPILTYFYNGKPIGFICEKKYNNDECYHESIEIFERYKGAVTNKPPLTKEEILYSVSTAISNATAIMSNLEVRYDLNTSTTVIDIYCPDIDKKALLVLLHKD